MRYNLLTGRRDDVPKEVSSLELWRIFLSLLNARASFEKWLHPKEIKVLAWILSNNDNVCYFSKPHSLRIMENIESLSMPELSRIKKRLLASELVEDVFDGKKVKTVPNAMLRKLRDRVNKSGDVDFSFHMKITE
jgi:hypothetical protein